MCFRWWCVPIAQSCHLHYCAPPPNYWTSNNTNTVDTVILTGYRDTTLGVCCPTFRHCALASTSTCSTKNSEGSFLHWTSDPWSSGHYMVLKQVTIIHWPSNVIQIWTGPLQMPENSTTQQTLQRTLQGHRMIKTVHVKWLFKTLELLILLSFSHALALPFVIKVISHHDY